MKKTLVILLSAALLLTVLSGCSKKPKSGTLPQKITIGTMVAIDPEGIAIAEGWLAELMGVEVDIVYFDSGRDINTAMTSGSIDFGITGSVAASLGIANGIPYQVVYIHSVVGEGDALIVRDNLGLPAADRSLAGLKIATTFTSSPHYSLMKYLEINKINPADINIIDMRTGDIAAAFLRGDIDGAFTWEPHVTQMKNNGGIMLTNARQMANYGYATMDLEIVRTEFAEKYPGLVRAYIRAMDRAVALYQNDPQAAGAAMAHFTGLTAEECLVQVASSTWLSVSDQRGLRWSGTSSLIAYSLYDTAMFLYEQGNIAEEPPPELFLKAVTGQYLDEYK